MAVEPRSTGGYNPYSVGNKIYGSGRFFPTMGPVDRTGYRERDARYAARRQVLLNKLKAQQSNNYGSANAQRKVT